MNEIELKKRKPTWDYMLNDLAFNSLKTRVLYGIFDNQESFDFEYQIELKGKEIERLNNIINDIDRYIHNWRLEDIGEKTMLILNDILLIKNGMSDEVIRLKGEDKE